LARAIWRGVILAESDRYEWVEGNVYFPPQPVRRYLRKPSESVNHCAWKGEAHYCDLLLNSELIGTLPGITRRLTAAAERIKDHVAFWRGVQVER
jgi:uncharacterized protein (DUF427 family)